MLLETLKYIYVFTLIQPSFHPIHSKLLKKRERIDLKSVDLTSKRPLSLICHTVVSSSYANCFPTNPQNCSSVSLVLEINKQKTGDVGGVFSTVLDHLTSDQEIPGSSLQT